MDVEVGDQGCRERNWRPADTCSVLVVQTLAVYLKWYRHLQWTVTLLSDSVHTNDANTLWMYMVGLAMIPPCPGVTGRSYSLRDQEIICFINLLSPNKTKNVNKSITK